MIADRAPGDVQHFLADLRREGLSVQTSNHYLRAIKQFSRWLVRDRRTNDDPLAHLSKMNVAVDRRHDRRALSVDEFACLVQAAEEGPKIECISGPDDLLFPISGSVPGGKQRRTAKMMQRDLERARKSWIKEAENEEEQRRREESDFLKYRDAAQDNRYQ